MTLKSRISEALQIRSSDMTRSVPEHEAPVLLRQQQEEKAHKLHTRRMLATRNNELNELRQIMAQRRRSETGALSVRSSTPLSPLSITRSRRSVPGSEMVSLINDLEVKVLSEPMGLTAPRPRNIPVAATIEAKMAASSFDSSKSHPLDDAALMVAARRWTHAADLLIKAIRADAVPEGTDWAMRCAIDLLERGGQPERAQAMRLQYAQRRGHVPRRIVPPPLNDAVSGRFLANNPITWKSPERLGTNGASSLEALLTTSKGGALIVVDWTPVGSIDGEALSNWKTAFEEAMRSQHVFIHLGLSALIRTLRLELQNQQFSRDAWSLWLALLNWTGFAHAHLSAASAYAKRYQESASMFRSVRCICQPLNLHTEAHANDLVCGARFQGDLTREHTEKLATLDFGAAIPGRLLVLDFRLLTSMDFFFGADLLNWVIRRHSRGESVAIAYAHPLLSHFLLMMGLQEYAKLLGPTSLRTRSAPV